MENIFRRPQIVTKHFWWLAAAAGAVAVGILTTVVLAVTPLDGGTVVGATVDIDTSAGDQTHPHVSGDLAAYTDAADSTGYRIRYYDFANANPVPNAAIPASADDFDTLSDVNQWRIAFSRFSGSTGTNACMVYNVASNTTMTIATGSSIGATAIGGDTVAFVSNGDILVGHISGGPIVNVSSSSDNDNSPAVSPGGDVVTWAACDLIGCAIIKSTYSGGVWSPSSVVRAAPAANPDTDGTSIVYDADGDIFIQPVSGGAATQLAIDGFQRNPSIAGGVIAFESAADDVAQPDLFVYQMSGNTVYRVTETLFTRETLNDVTVAPNGDVRVVWAANDDATGPEANNIYARTFTLPAAPPPPTPTPVYNFEGFFQPVDNLPAVNLATAGSSIPVKFSLGGDHGLEIFAAGYPASSPIACDASEPGTVIEETVNAGGSTLSYDAASDQYTYVWRTNRTWRGTCRMLVVGLNDGTQHFAKFRFR